MQLTRQERGLVNQAIRALEKRAVYCTEHVQSTHDAVDLCRLRMAGRESEGFAVLFLNQRHGLIKFRLMFEGTVDAATVYPREVVKAALHHNAAACILTHNHPSGDAEPSNADLTITRWLQEALRLIDVRVLDHIIVGTEDAWSMAKRGQM